MKFTTAFLSLVMFFGVQAAVAQAADDITPVTRDSGAIMTQFYALQAQLEKIQALMGASAVTATTRFTITIDEQQVVNKETTYMTPSSAQAQCEAVAYNTDNMWKLVTCTFGTEVLYRDVFIAG